MKREKNTAWLCLLASGLLEIVWAYFMKESHGFQVLLPSILTVIFLAIGFVLLERAIRVFGIGMSYGVFTGIGIVGTSVIGILAFDEQASLLKIVSIVVLMAGIIGLKSCDEKEVDGQ